MTPQAQKVLRHLKKHKSITHLEAFGVYGIYRLGARIYELRQAGIQVLTKYLKDETKRTYARYSLS